MLRDESPSELSTEEVAGPPVGALVAGMLIFEPVEPGSGRTDQISRRVSDHDRTHLVRCALAGALSRHGLMLETVEALENGSRFEVALVPQPDLFEKRSLREAVTAFIEEIERANRAFKTRSDERRQVARYISRLLSHLSNHHQRLVAPGIQAVIRPAPAQFRLFEEPSASAAETVAGEILSIDSKHHQVMFRGNRLVEGVRTEGLEVGQVARLRCTREGHGKIAVYRAQDPERGIQPGLNLSDGSVQR